MHLSVPGLAAAPSQPDGRAGSGTTLGLGETLRHTTASTFPEEHSVVRYGTEPSMDTVMYRNYVLHGTARTSGTHLGPPSHCNQTTGLLQTESIDPVLIIGFISSPHHLAKDEYGADTSRS